MSASVEAVEPVVVHLLGAPPEPGPVGQERRQSGRRARARDRLMDRATQDYSPNAALRGVDDLETTLLFVDDDLRETALAIERIESWLVAALDVLQNERCRRADVLALAGDKSVLGHVDLLNETLEGLRRRLAKLALKMR